MKIYVAGKDLKRAGRIMDRLRADGHEITFDWVVDINNKTNLSKKTSDERIAVQQADALVYLWESDQESARYEAGMAMGLNKPIIVSGNNSAFFLLLPEVVIAKSDVEICQLLNEID